MHFINAIHSVSNGLLNERYVVLGTSIVVTNKAKYVVSWRLRLIIWMVVEVRVLVDHFIEGVIV